MRLRGLPPALVLDREALGLCASQGVRSVAEPEKSQPAERERFNWKAILVAALGIYAGLLIVLNSKSVSVNFVVVTGKTRVIFLVLLCIALGALITWLVQRRPRRRRRRKRSEQAREERGGISWKAILLAAVGIYALLLIILNSKKVSIDFVVFTTKTRVIFLALLSIALGALIMWLILRMRRRRKVS
jgi:uncharacterized integral membrane protein